MFFKTFLVRPSVLGGPAGLNNYFLLFWFVFFVVGGPGGGFGGFSVGSKSSGRATTATTKKKATKTTIRTTKTQNIPTTRKNTILWFLLMFLLKLCLTFLVFWLLFWSPSCLKSSGRLLGTISTKFRANPTSSDPGSWENSITFSQLKIWRSCTPPMIQMFFLDLIFLQ